MPLNPGNQGPPDTSQWDRPTIMVFPVASPLPGIYRSDNLVDDRPEVYWSNPLLSNAGMFPIAEDADHMIKVWAPRALQPMEPPPGQETTTASFEDYRASISSSNGAVRTAGVYIQTEGGKVVNYRVALSGAEHRVNIATPQPIVDLLRLHNADEIPGRLNAIVKPHNIRLAASRPYSAWINLEQMGFNGVKVKIPNQVLERIYARYKLTSARATYFNIQLTVEYVVLPDDMAPNGLTNQLEEMLDSPGLRTLHLWTASHPYRWDRTFPCLPGVFNIKTPIPVVAEITDAEPGIFPSEWTLRRVVHDIFQGSLGGQHHTSLEQCMGWFTAEPRTYVHNRAAVLIVPRVPDYPEDYEYPTRELPGNLDGPYEEDPDGHRPPDNPAFQPLLPRFDQDPPESAGIEKPQQQPAEPPDNHSVDDAVPAGARHEKWNRFWNTDRNGPNQDPGKSTSYLTVTAKGKYRSERNCDGLINKFQQMDPDLNQDEAAELAIITQASIANKTANQHRSIQKTIQRLFPDRPQLFQNNKPADPLVIVARLKKAKYKEKTILQYIAAYDRLVINNGGTSYAKLPEMKNVVKGLRNLAHNPARNIAMPARKAFSLEALRLVGQKGVHLMKKYNKWGQYRSALYRAVILTMFFGRLRSAEVLSDNNNTCDLYDQLLASDVIIERNKTTGKPEAVLLLLRNCKYQEQNGALVVIPAINTDYCPVAALIKYLKLRNAMVPDQNLPLFMTDFLWEKGAARATGSSLGFYTKSRFRRDTKAAIKQVVQLHPNLRPAMDYLETHSLRSGMPTEMQILNDIPEEIRLQLGRWHSSSHQVYLKNLQQATKTAKTMEQSLLDRLI